MITQFELLRDHVINILIKNDVLLWYKQELCAHTEHYRFIWYSAMLDALEIQYKPLSLDCYLGSSANEGEEILSMLHNIHNIRTNEPLYYFPDYQIGLLCCIPSIHKTLIHDESSVLKKYIFEGNNTAWVPSFPLRLTNGINLDLNDAEKVFEDDTNVIALLHTNYMTLWISQYPKLREIRDEMGNTPHKIASNFLHKSIMLILAYGWWPEDHDIDYLKNLEGSPWSAYMDYLVTCNQHLHPFSHTVSMDTHEINIMVP